MSESDSAEVANKLSETMSSKHRISRTALMAVALSLLAIILALILHSCNDASISALRSACATSSPGPAGAQGLNAYELWLELGNQGSEKEFFASLVGTPGSDGYTGSDGMNGANGKSAYQLWLDAGNAGTPQQFLDSLVGASGNSGANGFSAYQLWIAEGNHGTVQDFFDSLAGVPGTPGESGTPGLAGMSAYEIWISNGHTGTESDFLISLVGPTGAPGAPGICTIGDTGPAGSNGLSAYELWLEAGNIGSEQVFLASLVGPIGLTGATGETGAQGPPGQQGIQGIQGEPGISAAVDSGSFWDLTIQGFDGLVSTQQNTAYPIYFSNADTANNLGVSVVKCAGDEAQPAGYPVDPSSCITFSHPGVYSIAFSAQLWRTQGGSANVISIWLRENGVDVPNTNTDVTMIANGQKLVAAWNFFAPVTCNGSCSSYQLMWSFSGDYSNLWYQLPQTSPDRPGIPSVIMTVNQVR